MTLAGADWKADLIAAMAVCWFDDDGTAFPLEDPWDGQPVSVMTMFMELSASLDLRLSIDLVKKLPALVASVLGSKKGWLLTAQ